jgi:hypothetical protein
LHESAPQPDKPVAKRNQRSKAIPQRNVFPFSEEDDVIGPVKRADLWQRKASTRLTIPAITCRPWKGWQVMTDLQPNREIIAGTRQRTLDERDGDGHIGSRPDRNANNLNKRAVGTSSAAELDSYLSQKSTYFTGGYRRFTPANQSVIVAKYGVETIWLSVH